MSSVDDLVVLLSTAEETSHNVKISEATVALIIQGFKDLLLHGALLALNIFLHDYKGDFKMVATYL